MNAKTYGQVLLDEMENGTEFERLSLVRDETMERCARAVILEFVMRVEERAQSFSDDSDIPIWAVNTYEKAFLQLSTELKESDQACDRCKGSGEVVDIRRGCDMGLMPCPKCKEAK